MPWPKDSPTTDVAEDSEDTEGDSQSELESSEDSASESGADLRTRTRIRRSRRSKNRRALIHDLFEFALQNFNALDELFQETGLSKGGPLSEPDLRRALNTLEYPNGSESCDATDATQVHAGEPCEEQLLDFCKFEMRMLRVRYLKHTLKPIVDAWRSLS